MGTDLNQLLRDRYVQLRDENRRGLIISPAALGDCLFMLPLAEFMKKSLNVRSVDFVGHTQYIDYFPGRTCIDGIRSIESVQFHRLFADHNEFVIEDKDPLLYAFEGYEWIASFLGHQDKNFEHNLIFTVNCSHAAGVSVLPLMPEREYDSHISRFHIDSFIRANFIEHSSAGFDIGSTLVRPYEADIGCGQELLKASQIDPLETLALIHPGSGGIRKCWYPDNFLVLAEKLRKKNIQPVFILGPAEMERFSTPLLTAIQAAGTVLTDLTLSEILQLLTCSDIFIGNDSGITHLAAAAGARTLAIFGPSDPVLYRPIGPNVSVFIDEPAAFAGPIGNVEQVLKTASEMLGAHHNK